jgi:hypothetical protein
MILLAGISTASRKHLSLARIIHETSTAASDPGMSTALRSVEFIDVPSSTPAEPFRRAASRRTIMNNPG